MSQPAPIEAPTHGLPHEVQRELAAAYRLAVAHRGTLVLELGADPKGTVRVRLVGIRGVSCADLDSGPIMAR